MQAKRCAKCGETKALEDFFKHKKSPDGRGSYCKMCSKEGRKEWGNSHPDKVKEYNAKYGRGYKREKQYGITEAQYDQMESEQGGVCAICTRGLPLVVDHDHTSGRVRGLLCQNCNRALGMMQDDLDRMVAAAAYILRTSLLEREDR